MTSSSAALPACFGCILCGLCKVLNPEKIIVSETPAQKRRGFLIEMAWMWIPVIYFMSAHWFVQSNRYDLVAIFECEATFDDSWMPVVIIFMWPCVLMLVDAYFACKLFSLFFFPRINSRQADKLTHYLLPVLLLYRLKRYRRDFSSVLTHSRTSKARFTRLTLICSIFIVVLTPLQFYVLLQNTTPSEVTTGYQNSKLTAYPFAEDHDPIKFQIIDRHPTNGAVIWDRWIRVGAGLLMFIFFGLWQDACIMYKAWLRKVGVACLLSKQRQPHQHTPPSSSAAAAKSSYSWLEHIKKLWPTSCHLTGLTLANPEKRGILPLHHTTHTTNTASSVLSSPQTWQNAEENPTSKKTKALSGSAFFSETSTKYSVDQEVEKDASLHEALSWDPEIPPVHSTVTAVGRGQLKTREAPTELRRQAVMNCVRDSWVDRVQENGWKDEVLSAI